VKKLKLKTDLPRSLAVGTLILALIMAFIQLPKLIDGVVNKTTKINDYKVLADSLLGLKGKKNILILFMNNAEQRYGGGFIGSVGYVTVDGGKIKADPVKSVYYYDRYLEAKFPPPELNDPELGLEADTLRNSGQNVSWLRNGERAKEIFKSKTGKSADMVIGITPEVLKVVLAKTGPIYLPEYSKSISADNIIDILQTEVEFGKDKVEGKDPKSILAVLANKLIEKLSSENIYELSKLGESLKNEMSTKQILLYSSDADLAASIARLNYAGAIARNTNDYFQIEEYNRSIDKSNAFIDRSIDRKINIGKNGDVRVDLLITRLQNREKSIPYIDPRDNGFTFLIKENNSDIRVVLPRNSVVIEAESIALKKVESKDFVDIYEFNSSLTPLEAAKYKISYMLPTKVSNSGSFNFDSYVQIQNGGWPYQLSSELVVPNEWSLVASNKREIDSSTNIIRYSNKNVDRDVFLSLVFAKNK